MNFKTKEKLNKENPLSIKKGKLYKCKQSLTYTCYLFKEESLLEGTYEITDQLIKEEYFMVLGYLETEVNFFSKHWLRVLYKETTGFIAVPDVPGLVFEELLLLKDNNTTNT